MRRAVFAAVVLVACGDNAGNPPTLWLAPDMMETKVKLIDHEPPPY